MPDGGWLGLLAAALGGGVTVKALDILYQEVRHRFDRSRSAKQFVDQHLDPLKAADELVGKLRSLAESDFRELPSIDLNTETLESSEFGSVLFLFAQFWAHVEIVRQKGLSVTMNADERGKKLQRFLDCLESRRVRVVDRITQRAVGEVMIEGQNGDLNTIPFVRFVKAFETDTQMRRWMLPLVRVVSRTRHTHERQCLLQYGAVLHALIDTLDPKHLATRSRPAYPNKLSRRSWRALRYRVFGVYLPFVPSTDKYLGTKK